MTPPCLLDIDPAAYHRDPCPTPSLSASIAKELLACSPFHAWLKHPRFGNVRSEATKEMDRGTILHALVLGTHCPVTSIAADNYRTKAAQDARDAAYEAGQVPVLAREYDAMLRVADAILVGLKSEGIALAGKSEQAIVWEEETLAGRILCRGMIDHLILTDTAGDVLDLKTCDSADPRRLGRKCTEFGYDVQHAAYLSALEQLRPDLAGRINWRWVFIEELPAGSPKRVILTIAEPSGTMRELGRARWSRACELWAKCLKDNRWPGYVSYPVFLEAPEYVMKEELGL